ncbi:MAG: DUF6250 domain-containing protein [Saprospiraceae bacterium]|nr:hypothetical protein [Lewinella sp.]
MKHLIWIIPSLCLTLTTCLNRAHRNVISGTQPSFFDAFDYPEGPLPENYWSEGAPAEIRDGHLYVNANLPDQQAATVWLRREWSGDLLIRFKAHVLASAKERNNINFFLLYSDPLGTPLEDTRDQRSDGRYARYHDLNGYLFTYVQEPDSAEDAPARFRFRDVPGFDHLLAERYTYTGEGQTTRQIAIEKRGDRISYSVDDQLIFSVRDTMYNRPHTRGLIGFRTFGTELWWDDLSVTDL